MQSTTPTHLFSFYSDVQLSGDTLRREKKKLLAVARLAVACHPMINCQLFFK